MTQHIPAEERAADSTLPEPDQWLAEYGDALYRFALDRLRRPHEAEEAVQETLLAALKARSQFRGQSHPRTWMTAILKRKILDRLRASSRQAAETDPAELDAWFDSSGHWRKSPRAWANPAEAAERSEFWGVVRELPGETAGAHGRGVHAADARRLRAGRGVPRAGDFVRQPLGTAAPRPAAAGALPGNQLVRLRAIIMLTCRHATRLISDKLDRSLSWFERLSLRVHLLGCGPCSRFRRAVRWLHNSLASAPETERLPPEARERIRVAMERAACEE